MSTALEIHGGNVHCAILAVSTLHKALAEYLIKTQNGSKGSMIEKLSITVLLDNVSHSEGLLCEHGLALWIVAGGRRILFDTGQSEMLIRNAEVLGIDLRTADTLVLSHGHYDHTGGVADVLDLNPEISVYSHPGIFMPRYSRQPDGKMKPVGIATQASVEQVGCRHG